MTALCKRCQFENVDSAKFCLECGNDLRNLSEVRRPCNLKIMHKEQVNELLNYSFWDTGSEGIGGASELKYLLGIEYEDGTSIEHGVSAVMNTYKKGLRICLIFSVGKSLYTALPYEDIIYISFTEGDYIQEHGNMVGGAVLGGILLGPLGAILGGMSQAGSTNVKPSLLVIGYKSKGQEKGSIIFAIKSGQKQKVYEFITKNERISKFYKPG